MRYQGVLFFPENVRSLSSIVVGRLHGFLAEELPFHGVGCPERKRLGAVFGVRGEGRVAAG